MLAEQELSSRENNKFREATGNLTAVAVVNPDGTTVGSSPTLPTGAATLAEQQAQTALLTTIESNQLPDGHNVTVDNLPSEYPLPASQVTTLTPPAAITGFATSVKQDNIITELQTINSLVPSVYDYINLSYTGDNLTGVVFKSGGSGGTTVSTLTLAYTGSNLTSVTKT